MKKMFVIAMSAAALLSAAPMTASACDGQWEPAEPANVRVTVRLTKEELYGDARFDQTVRVTDRDGDGMLETLDAVESAFYVWNPNAKDVAYANGCIWGNDGRYRVFVTDGSGKQELGYRCGDITDYNLSDGLWVHVEPFLSSVDVYALEPVEMDPLHRFEMPFGKGDTVTLRTVKYPADDYKPVPVPFTELVIDGIPTGKMTCADGYATISLDSAEGLHWLSAKFRDAKDGDTVLGEYGYNYFEDAAPYWVSVAYARELVQNAIILAAETTTAPAVTTTAAQTTTTTAAETTAVTAASESTTAPETTAVITTAAETTAAPAATTVPTTAAAKQTSATGSTKAGSLQTGDSMPVAALLFAGLAAAGTAVALSRKRKEQ